MLRVYENLSTRLCKQTASKLLNDKQFLGHIEKLWLRKILSSLYSVDDHVSTSLVYWLQLQD